MALTDGRTGGQIVEGLGLIPTSQPFDDTIYPGDIVTIGENAPGPPVMVPAYDQNGGLLTGLSLAVCAASWDSRLPAVEDDDGVIRRLPAFLAAIVRGRHTGGTPGAALYVGDTSGLATDAVGTNENDLTHVIGRVIDTETVILWPQLHPYTVAPP